MPRVFLMRGVSMVVVVMAVVLIYIMVMAMDFYTSNPVVSPFSSDKSDSRLQNKKESNTASVPNNITFSRVSPDKNLGHKGHPGKNQSSNASPEKGPPTNNSSDKEPSLKASPDKGQSPKGSSDKGTNSSRSNVPSDDDTISSAFNSGNKSRLYDLPEKISYQTVFKVNNYTIVRHPALHIPSPSFSGHNSKVPKNISQVTHLPYNPTLENANVTDVIYNEDKANATHMDGKSLKIILYWNDHFGKDGYGFGLGHKPFLLAGCRVNTCMTTADRKRFPMDKVDAVMWNVRSRDQSLPEKRYPNTRYVFCAQDSPMNTSTDLTKYKDVFNMTFTYRRNSDVYAPSSRVFRRRSPLPIPPTPFDYTKGKTKMAALFVSFCHAKSGRNELVQKLQKWVKVDTYGECGSMECNKTKDDECLQMMEKKYKFVLAFEDSICLDYVSPRFFKALSYNIVPVVWGFAKYTSIAPPHSYIDAFDFPSVYYLADYLLYLDSNATAYNEYFWWKPYYYQLNGWLSGSIAWCSLCEQLHVKDPKPKTYDIDKWFRVDSHCLTNNDTVIQKYIKVNHGS